MSPSRPANRRPGGAAALPAGVRVLGAERAARGAGRRVRIAIAASRFNQRITDRLLAGAFEALEREGVRPGDLTLVTVPGAYELPFAARRLAASGHHDAVLCLGAVIRGGTPHFDYVAGEAARGIAAAGAATDVPVLFGVLTTDTLRQALDRSGGRLGNRGADTAAAAVEMARLARALPGRRRA